MTSDVVARHTLLDEPAAVSLLIYLHDAGTVVGDDLKNVVSNYTRMKSLAQAFEQKGMISIKREKRPMIVFSFSLTEKGRKVAEHLIAAADLVGPQ